MNDSRPSHVRGLFGLQFGLRTLLIAVSVLGIGLGTVSYEARRQRQIVAAFEKAGVEIGFSKVREKPSWMPAMLDTDYLARVENLVAVDVLVSELDQLVELRNLRTLGLRHCRDRDLTVLMKLKNLDRLLLYDPQIDQAASFEGLKNLRYVHFHQNYPSDEAEEKLEALRMELGQYLPYCRHRGTSNTRN